MKKKGSKKTAALLKWVKSFDPKRSKRIKTKPNKYLKAIKQRFQIIFLGYQEGKSEVTTHEVFGLLDRKKQDFLRGTFDKEHVLVFANYLNKHPDEATRFQYAKET